MTEPEETYTPEQIRDALAAGEAARTMGVVAASLCQALHQAGIALRIAVVIDTVSVPGGEAVMLSSTAPDMAVTAGMLQGVLNKLAGGRYRKSMVETRNTIAEDPHGH